MSRAPAPILIVDDQPSSLALLEALLTGPEVRTVAARTGEEALALTLEGEFAAIVLDVQMPGMSGFEVARALRSRQGSRALPILFLTAGETPEFPIREAYALGAVDYLVKPVLPEVLRAKVAFFVDVFRQANLLREAERRSAEASLREQRELWQTTLASIGDAVIATDAAAVVTFVNGEAERLTGCSRAEAVGGPLDAIFRVVHEATRETVACPVRRVIETGQRVGLADDTILVARDGSERPIDDSAAPIRGESGELLGVVLVFRDISDRHRSARQLQEREEALRRWALEASATAEANAKFRVFFEQGTQFAALMALDGTMIEANRMCLDACGFRREDVIGRRFWECGWWNRSPALMAMVERASLEAAQGRVFRAETNYYVADGSERCVDLIVTPVTDDAGRVLFVAPTGADITERKHAEAAMRATDERLKLLVENIKDYAVVITDHERTVIEWQGGAERITGFDARAMIGRSADLLFTPEDRAAGKPAEEANRAAHDGRAEDRRWHMRADGSRFFADGVTVALRDGGTELRGFGKLFRDATGDVLADLGRRRHTEQLRRLAEVSSRLNAVLDLDSVLGVVTEEGRALVGAHQAAIHVDAGAAGAIRTVAHADEPAGEPWPAPALISIGDRAVRLTRDQLAARGDGSRMQGLLAAPIVGRNGERLGVIQLTDKRDGEFTEDDEAILVQLAQMASVAVENTRLYQALRDADRRKDEFLAMLAHELRNPLAPMQSALSVLNLRGSQEDAAVRLRAVISRQVNHLSRLVDDLLDVARITRGKVTLQREPVELARVVAQAVETSRPMIDAKRHTLRVELAPDAMWLDADPVRLSQVIANLLNNAAKYTDDGGQIRVSAAREGEWAVLRVADDGIGLPPELLPTVFDLFTQASTGIARSAGGLGIGLTLVRRLVELHGGTVSVHSGGLGTGSEFVVRLPVAPGLDAAASGPGPASGEAGRRVLVVDDNPDALETMSMLLEMFGHEVATAPDGVLAVEVARAFRPEVMFLDLGLPGRDGYEVARILRREFPRGTMWLVALSGYGQAEDRRRTQEVGFDQHLVKPVDPETLEMALRGPANQ